MVRPSYLVKYGCFQLQGRKSYLALNLVDPIRDLFLSKIDICLGAKLPSLADYHAANLTSLTEEWGSLGSFKGDHISNPS